MEKLETYEQFEQITDKSFFILKNSITCPISQAAYEEFEQFAAEQPDNCYYLNVQDARELSNKLAEQYEVKHESPQVLLVNNGKVVWHDSHWEITNKKLTDVKKEFVK